MARVFTLPSGCQILWPNACVVCGSHELAAGAAHGSSFTGVGWWGLGYSVNYDKATIGYPICRRHLWHARFARFVYFTSFLLALIAAITLLDGPRLFSSPLTLAAGLLAVVLFIWAAISAPVRIKPGPRENLIVTINNEIYAEAFEHLNKDLLAHYQRAITPSREALRGSMSYRLGRWFARLIGRG